MICLWFNCSDLWVLIIILR